MNNDELCRKGNIQVSDNFPTSVDGIKEYIRDLVKCPVPCEYDDQFAHLSERLYKYWKEVSESFQIDLEANYIGDELQESLQLEIDDDYEYLRSNLINILRWIDMARNKFINDVGFIHTVVASDAEYAKHFPLKKIPKSEIHDFTMRSKVSLLYPGINKQNLGWVLSDVIEDHFDQILHSGKHKVRFVIDCINAVGSSCGEETSFLYVEIHKDNKIAHCYPVRMSDITGKVVCRTDVLQGRPAY